MKRENKILCKSKFKVVTNNKKFWRTIKPCFSNKSGYSENIVLGEKNIMVTEDGNFALTLNNVFPNIGTSLNMPKFKDCDPLSERILQPALSAILQYKNHASINAIRKYIRCDQQFFYLSRKGRYNKRIKFEKSKSKRQPKNQINQ